MKEADKVVLPVRAHGQPRANPLQNPPVCVELLHRFTEHNHGRAQNSAKSRIGKLQKGSKIRCEEERRGRGVRRTSRPTFRC